MEKSYEYYEIAAYRLKSLTECAVILWHKVTATKLLALS